MAPEIAVGWGDSLRSMDEQVFSCLLGNKADLGTFVVLSVIAHALIF